MNAWRATSHRAGDREQAQIARAAYRDFGKGSGHRAGLNFGDCFAYALARDRNEPLLFKGDDFRHTEVQSAGTATERHRLSELFARYGLGAEEGGSTAGWVAGTATQALTLPVRYARSRPAPEDRVPAFDVEALRREFPALASEDGGRPVAFFDGPGGTQVPQRVIDAVGDYYRT